MFSFWLYPVGLATRGHFSYYGYISVRFLAQCGNCPFPFGGLSYITSPNTQDNPFARDRGTSLCVQIGHRVDRPSLRQAVGPLPHPLSPSSGFSYHPHRRSFHSLEHRPTDLIRSPPTSDVPLNYCVTSALHSLSVFVYRRLTCFFQISFIFQAPPPRKAQDIC